MLYQTWHGEWKVETNARKELNYRLCLLLLPKNLHKIVCSCVSVTNNLTYSLRGTEQTFKCPCARKATLTYIRKCFLWSHTKLWKVSQGVVFIMHPNHIYIFHANGCCTQYTLMISHMNHLHNLQDKFTYGYKLLNEYHSARNCVRDWSKDLFLIWEQYQNNSYIILIPYIREFSIGFVYNNSMILTIKRSY